MSDTTATGGGLRVTVLEPESGTPRLVAIDPDPADGTSRCNLRCIAGADAVHVAVHDAQGLRFRCEVPAPPGTDIELTLIPDGSGGLTVESNSPRLRLLPAAAPDPLPVLPALSWGWLADPCTWEVALVVDGTARWFEPPSERTAGHSDLLLANTERWGSARAKLLALVVALARQAGAAGLRLAVRAFGDHAIPGVDAVRLRPTYLLTPARASRAGELAAFDPAVATALLTTLQASPGGDYVDALADALAACQDLSWTAGARKLLIVFGDSPGHSITHPLAPGGDALVRLCDVDREAAALHARGIEILTLYLRPPAWLAQTRGPKARLLLEQTEEQYRRLASLPGYALDFEHFDPDALARQLGHRPHPIGRGASYGLALSDAAGR